ncbi:MULTISPECIES: MlaE family ABC transporter permease [Marinobacter]|jgi:phospholipid/cholesterol/gamma-HCH transport system permease protein|uniref:MlaE family ABC transporter permease n=1 Tax=Marinobacter TaxID=2742 RepID=UPI000C8A6200|nr:MULTISPECIES: ABC transporter permease [unclassified Marinobacter]MAB50541.1 ABC transporter permease [Marinobacter sp.]|tara:strand:+ start:91 stop:1215 length:1125 start_codon:yes stop_codon:yes gene_type:complete
MPSPGKLEFQNGQLTVSGDWTLPNYGSLKRDVQKATAMELPNGHSVNLATINALDTAGASLLVDLLGARQLHELTELTPGLSSERQELLRLIANAMASPEGEKSLRSNPITEFLAGVGEKIEDFWHQQRLLIGFTGQILATLASILATPWRWRITSLVAHVHQTGLNALPIVALLTFLVGAVVAFLGATILDDFGATIYTVNLVAFSFLREFGVLLAAILLAGRTASAFTAQLGSMKANEEIDALRTFGLSPIELLVIPRVLAMVVSLPILTFVGMISGIVGGSLVCVVALDISVPQILNILETKVRVVHLLVGLGKAPIFAFVIAVIGCLEGFKASGSAQSVGEHTTSAVVQSIFMVILLDSIAAIFFMEMGW